MLAGVRERIRQTARWESTFVRFLGMAEVILGIMLLCPVLVALIYGEDPTIFLYPVPILLVCGTFQYVFFKKGRMESSARGILLMSLAWILAFAVSAIPFYMYGFSLVDSIFEGVSGFTTTGASIVTDLEALPRSLLFWRSFIQWVAGIAVVMIFIFLLPMMGIGGRTFLNNELSGSGTAKYSMRMKDAAKSFIMIYILLSAAELVLLMLCSLDMLDAMCITMSTISTGGMTIRGDSFMGFGILIQVVVLFFMFMGGTNFYLHYRALYKRDIRAYTRSQEFVWTVIWFLLCAFVVCVVVVLSTADIGSLTLSGSLQYIWNAVFTTVSIGTSTGFAITDYTLWPMAAILVLMIVAVIGSMSGSTAAGIKMYRIILVGKYVKNGIYRMMHPNVVKDVKMDGISVERDAVWSALVVLLLFILTGTVTMVFLAFSEPGLGMLDYVGLTTASLANIGVGLGDFGPLGGFAGLSDASKLFLSFVMWAGRIEIVMALILFTRVFWSDVFRSVGGSNKIKGERGRLRTRGNKGRK